MVDTVVAPPRAAPACQLPWPKRAPASRVPGPALALVPLDGTPQAERALPFAIAHARASGDRLVLAGIAPRALGSALFRTVLGPTIPGPGHPAPTMARYLRWIAETLAEHNLTARVSLCVGTGARAIADAARLWGADLVIVAAHDFGGPPADVKHLARTVTQRAAVPVLLVPAPGADAAHEDRLVEWRGWRGAGTGQGHGHAPANAGGRA